MALLPHCQRALVCSFLCGACLRPWALESEILVLKMDWCLERRLEEPVSLPTKSFLGQIQYKEDTQASSTSEGRNTTGVTPENPALRPRVAQDLTARLRPKKKTLS